MIAAVADCFSALKSSRKKSPYCVSYKSGDLPIVWFFNLETLLRFIFPSRILVVGLSDVESLVLLVLQLTFDQKHIGPAQRIGLICIHAARFV